MSSVASALIVALLTSMSALLGFFVQWLLPAQHEADAVTGSILGLVTLLLALRLANDDVFTHPYPYGENATWPLRRKKQRMNRAPVLTRES